jgi:hypothetical protein
MTSSVLVWIENGNGSSQVYAGTDSKVAPYLFNRHNLPLNRSDRILV